MTILEEIRETYDRCFSESNAARRAETKPKKEDYLLNKKTPKTNSKKIIVDNEASKKYVSKYYKNLPTTGKILLEPTSNNSYILSVSVDTKSYPGKTRIYNNINWITDQDFLDKKGVEALLNNILPPSNNKFNGEKNTYETGFEKRRKDAVKERNKLGQEKTKEIIDDYKNHFFEPRPKKIKDLNIKPY